jgi:hypothetical protein
MRVAFDSGVARRARSCSCAGDPRDNSRPLRPMRLSTGASVRGLASHRASLSVATRISRFRPANGKNHSMHDNGGGVTGIRMDRSSAANAIESIRHAWFGTPRSARVMPSRIARPGRLRTRCGCGHGASFKSDPQIAMAFQTIARPVTSSSPARYRGSASHVSSAIPDT